MALLLLLAVPVINAAQPPDPDGRIDLRLTAEERAQFLAEMRQMLASIQGILEGIGSGDRERIAAAARQSGNTMARATPDTVRAKLPPAFREIGGPTHMLFEELAIRAESPLCQDRCRLLFEELCVRSGAPSRGRMSGWGR